MLAKHGLRFLSKSFLSSPMVPRKPTAPASNGSAKPVPPPKPAPVGQPAMGQPVDSAAAKPSGGSGSGGALAGFGQVVV